MSKKRILILEVTDPEVFRVSIDMSQMPGLDYALNMLGQAIRILENKQKFLSDELMVAERMQQAADQQIVSTLRKQ